MNDPYNRIAIKLLALIALLAAGFTLLPVVVVHIIGNGITLDGATIKLMATMFALKLAMLLMVLAGGVVVLLCWRYLRRGGDTNLPSAP